MLAYIDLLDVCGVVVIERKVRGSDAFHERDAIRRAGRTDNRETEMLRQLRGCDAYLWDSVSQRFKNHKYGRSIKNILVFEALNETNIHIVPEILNVNREISK